MGFSIEGTEFMLDGKPFKIISGSVHYFRSPSASWSDILYNLKAVGCNTVETYIPWNMHEQVEGVFNFTDGLDIAHFVHMAQELGLWVILRPSPYICAEWEFGGLPAWLLNYRSMRLRSPDPQFIAKVERYYKALFAHIAPLQITQGGPVLMMQLENEYGSFGNDKTYLRAILALMHKFGCDVPIFTSDGEWVTAQRAGNLMSDGILPTGNFGSKAAMKFEIMKKLYEAKFPLMCMEFWDGWFNRYGEKIIRRDAAELGEEIKEALSIGSINLYMFHGGTNFGFMNGCSTRGNVDLPQVTSYDYDAILNEMGNPTDKYYVLANVIKEVCPDIQQMQPRIKRSQQYQAELVEKVSYLAVKEQISRLTIHEYPQTMEAIGASYGYVLYEYDYAKDNAEDTFKIVDARDRMHFFLNDELLKVAYQSEIDEPIVQGVRTEQNTISILFENMGRVNYGAKLFAETQRKGIRTGVMRDLHFMSGAWRHYVLIDELLSQADFTKDWQPQTPALYKYELHVTKLADTFIDLTGFGKGFVVVNGKNIGRFWEKGPYLSLYVPQSLLQLGSNEVIIFETEGRFTATLSFSNNPVYLAEEELNEPIKK